jgi:hypothetical protein
MEETFSHRRSQFYEDLNSNTRRRNEQVSARAIAIGGAERKL